MASRSSEAPSPRAVFLPDFCTARVVLAIVLIVELTALVLAVARDHSHVGFWQDLGRLSLFLLWIGLTSAALLCALRPRLAQLSIARASALTIALLVLLVAAISEVTWQIDARLFGGDLAANSLVASEHGPFLLRNMLIAAIVASLTLRYFYVSHQWRQNVELQAQARVHALQARIRPHFLFNSMNTIAALTRSNPALAESAVNDLADLFRANLNDKRGSITLAEEIDVARIYERVEKLRLGPRLTVDWRLDGVPATALVPGLLLQPLLENAIYHGIEPRPDGGVITITGELNNGLITIVVRNPVPDSLTPRDGNRIALANIRERLMLLYDRRATIKAGRFDDEYIVTLRFPYVQAPRA
ncbi:MAG: histidine kinase [Steroidobacteraceae bacterium]|nr:histidine kinase [Steroidobacteraceae bacterium]MDW8258956.1 histidine kinase [Gammaproteobacteria bacterium]